MRYLIFTGWLLALLHLSASAQNLLTNGDFEDPIFANPSINSAPAQPGWSGIPFILAGDNGSPWPDSAAAGNQFANIGNGGGFLVQQTFSVPASGLASITWSATISASLNSGTYRVRLLAVPGGAVLESEVFTALGGMTNKDIWDPETLAFSSGPHGSGDYTLTFQGVSTSGLDILVDNVVVLAHPTPDSTISTTGKHAWAANAGWIDFRPSSTTGAIVGEGFLSRHAYAANIGWINLGDGVPANGYRYANTDGSDHGVNVDPNGDLGGLAWSANVGWLKFDAATGINRARIDLLTGEFHGYAYAANAGWIQLGGGGLVTDRLHCDDLDDDGLADAWERREFGHLGANGSGDDDNDGATNAEEYAALSDPNDISDRPPQATLSILEAPIPAASDLRVLDIDAVPGRIYQLQTSPDLVTWTAFGNHQNPASAGPLSFVGGSVTDPDIRKFFKIDISKPLP